MPAVSGRDQLADARFSASLLSVSTGGLCFLGGRYDAKREGIRWGDVRFGGPWRGGGARGRGLWRVLRPPPAAASDGERRLDHHRGADDLLDLQGSDDPLRRDYLFGVAGVLCLGLTH